MRTSPFVIGTLNARGLVTRQRLHELEAALFKPPLVGLHPPRLDLLALTEVRRPVAASSSLRASGAVFLHSGRLDNSHGGVGFIVPPSRKADVERFEAVSPRLAVLDLRLSHGLLLRAVVVYAPADSRDLDGFSDLLEQAEVLLAAPSPPGVKLLRVLLGDFNAQVGVQQPGDACLGRYGTGGRNAKGMLLVDFLHAQDLRLAHSFFPKSSSRLWTWCAPNGRCKTFIDYIAVDKTLRLTDAATVSSRTFIFETDHRLLRATLQVPVSPRRAIYRQPLGPRKLDPPLFLYALEQQLSHFDASSPVAEMLDSLRVAVNTATEIASNDEPHQPRLSGRTLKLLARRHQLKQEAVGQTRVEYVAVCHALRRSWAEDLRTRHHSLLLDAVKKGSSLRRLKTSEAATQTRISQLRLPDGRLSSSKADLEHVVKTFYDDLYTSRVAVDFAPAANGADDFPPILETEIINALARSRGGTTPGPDGVAISSLRLGRRLLAAPLAALFNTIAAEGAPRTLADSKTVLLYKKGDAADIANYRPISLLSSISKLFTKTLATRAEKQLDEETRTEQAGFRRGYSTVDCIYPVIELMSKSWEYAFPLYFVFVDFEKAFDSVEQNAVYSALRRQAISETAINALRSLADTAVAEVAVADSRVPIAIRRGVRQGDSLSPRLFTTALEDALRLLDWDQLGISIDGLRLSHLLFADDVALISHRPADMQRMIDELSATCSGIGLKINARKTVAMTNVASPRPLYLGDQQLNYVEEFVYLGRHVSFQDFTTRELGRRISSAWNAFRQNRDFFVNRRTPMQLKRRLFHSTVLPAFLYGSETWITTKADLQRLAVAQHRMERVMVGVTLADRKTNAWLRGVTKLKDVIAEAKKRKLNWARRLSRMNRQRWPRRLAEWTPRSRRRPPGRPRRRWRDDIVQQYGAAWLTVLEHEHPHD